VRREFFAPVGLFGIAVTAGLLAYEVYTRGVNEPFAAR
jgi:hypothetical protein